MDELGILTYKDRELFKNKLSENEFFSKLTDDELIQQFSHILQNYQPANAEDNMFQQYSFDLINVLRVGGNEEAHRIAKSALAFLISIYQPENENLWELPTKQRAYITGLAINEISKIVSLTRANEISGLKPDERNKAEELLIDFASNTDQEDSIVISYVNNILELYERGNRTPLILRYLNNIRFLVKVLEGRDYSTENRSWARGALSYIRLNEDVIPDDHGLIGLLDDMYVANLSVNLIEPNLPPLNELVLELNKVWPILNNLIISSGKSEYVYTDIASINSALVCLPLRGEEKLKTALVLPFAGITPNMISIATVFGAISILAKTVKDGPDFNIGDLVCVDNTAVAIYDGIDQVDGADYICLSQIKKANKKQPESVLTHRIPLADSARLCPASAESKTRGEIPMFLKHTRRELSAIESLFHLPFPLQFHNMDTNIWLISPANKMRALASDLSIYGQTLINIFPMGHIKRDGTYEAWSTRFGESESILTVVSDLDLAAEILEEKDEFAKDLVIADLSGANRNRFSSLERIIELDINILFIVEERDEELVSIIERHNPDIWEWSRADVKALGPSSQYSRNNKSHPFFENDNRLVRGVLLKPLTKVVQLDPLEQCHILVSALGKQLSEEIDDISADFDEIYNKLFSLFMRLTRMPFPVSGDWWQNEEELICLLEQRLSDSVFLSENEKKIFSEVYKYINQSGQKLIDSNPKWIEIRKFLLSSPDAKILIPNNVVIPDDVDGQEKFVLMSEIYSKVEKFLLVPFWPGKKQAWRLLAEVNFKEITFLVYPYEEAWCKSFMQHRESSRISRIHRRGSKVLFPKVGRWPDRIDSERGNDIQSQSPKVPDLIEINSNYRISRLLKTIESTEEGLCVNARLVGFDGGSHAFLSSNYEARVVTHLLDADAHRDEELSVKYSTLDGVMIGDVLIFLKGSDKDAIRMIADQNLPEGRRELAKLWQVALIDYVERDNVSLSQLVSQLSREGCKKHKVTVRNWLDNENIIAPRDAHRGDLDAIARVTNNRELETKLGLCQNAITEVWGHHLKAANMLARSVLVKIDSNIHFNNNVDEPIEIIDGIVMARVEFIGTEIVQVPRIKANRLMED